MSPNEQTHARALGMGPGPGGERMSRLAARGALHRVALHRVVALALALALLVLGGCAGARVQGARAHVPPPTPWIEDGVALGHIERQATPTGFELRHVDRAGRLGRVLRVDLDDQPLPGASRVDYAYDGRGRLVSEHYRDASGAPCLNDEGFAIRRVTYAELPDGRFEQARHEDGAGDPVITSSGFCVERVEYDRNGRVEAIHFRDTVGQRTGVHFESFEGVSDVEYVRLKGTAGEVLYRSLLGTGRQLLHKQRVKGVTKSSWHSQRTTVTVTS